ncbi:MAG: hypothetical protein CEO22_575 [Candidatus Berkelbacteria bacterium Gr01-1014_85]|uniref:Uncharacterized protein n=1 Tax=Candidatus Berkelbacteria bacterium Gr01-1014_85 TaxID=2017150 RepID=A0A554JA17_9BACT|nr:MAG: hypothetical protein CEO22_575 [Candidatus Berkelbacteria bacterium Gr01-1014_85]
MKNFSPFALEKLIVATVSTLVLLLILVLAWQLQRSLVNLAEPATAVNLESNANPTTSTNQIVDLSTASVTGYLEAD